jgi:hypothetical protein
MQTIWTGKLTRGGCEPEPFQAELVVHEGKRALIERKGLSTTEVSPNEVNPASLVEALADVIMPKIR